MRAGPSPADIAQYRRDGFIAIPDLLDARELAELKAATLSTVASYGDMRLLGQGENWKEKPDDYYSRVFAQRLNLWKSSPVVKDYMLGPGIGRWCAELAGVDLRVWHDQALFKPPWGNPTAWHLDNPYWSFHSRDAISIWIALEDTTLANGCMWYVPGSHLCTDPAINVGIGQHIGALFDRYPALREREPVAVPLRAGSAAVHNGMTAHGAGANMTHKPRMGMTCAYMPAGSRYNGIRNILSEERHARLAVGDCLDDDVDNPLVWSAAWAETVPR
jgi:phytanoyl-CoA hydroxylase